jgi:hypothetical protein
MKNSALYTRFCRRFIHLKVAGDASRRVVSAAVPFLFTLTIFAGWAVPTGYSQSGQPRTVEADVPFEMMAPWFTPSGELEDEVRLVGTLHVTTRTWARTSDHIDRFALHANAVDIHGTSATTGQRFRLTGSFGYDLRDPEVTWNPDGSFNVPPQPWKLHFFKVDPEPAILTKDLFGTSGASGAAIGAPPPITIPCQRVLGPDGNPTPTINCGNLKFTYFYTQVPSLYRVVSSGGSACTPGTACVVPDGATLYNGQTGNYNPPLFGQIRIYTGNVANGNGGQGAYSVKWHCRTGNQEVPVATSSFSGGLHVGRCDPLYSATQPVEMWAETKFQYWEYLGFGGGYTQYATAQALTADTTERVFRFKWDARAVNLPPVIQGITVRAVALVDERCPIGTDCELNNGDILFADNVGNYGPNLSLQISASDPEGDALIIEWFCVSGSSFFNAITNQGSPNAGCNPAYSWPDPVQVYARVSDGTNQVWALPPREFFMLHP